MKILSITENKTKELNKERGYSNSFGSGSTKIRKFGRCYN